METQYDRAAEDLGNIVALEHVNVLIPDQRLATLFYVTGLGLTRDPYMFTGVTNMWVNAGRSQFHLPTGDPLVLRGRTGLVVPDLDVLLKTLESVREPLDGTRFDFNPGEGAAGRHVDATCPWGNRVRCHGPHDRFGSILLGMPYVQFDVPSGAAEGIACFYREIFGAPSTLGEADGVPAARISVGNHQELLFRETDAPLPEFDGHHIQIYIVDFSGPYGRLLERGLVSREDNQYQYRFMDIVDLASGDALFTLEHEVRSMTHPLYARPLVNRSPGQSNVAYAPGHENQPWAMPFSA